MNGTPTTKGTKMFTEYRNTMLSSGLGVGTVNLYISKLERLSLTRADIHEATTADLEAYLAARRSTLAAETRKSIRSAFCSYYGWAHRNGFIDNNPADRLLAVHIPTTVPRVAADEVVQMGLLTADLRLTAMIMLARYGCLRLTELTTLHTRQREFDLLRVTGKGEKQRLVPINEPLMHVLLQLERENGAGYYFPGRSGSHLHPMSVNKMITRHLGTNPHSLRHAGATAAYRVTGDLRAVQMLLGHSSMATTQRYLHIGMDEVRRAAAGTAIITPMPTFPKTTLARTA